MIVGDAMTRSMDPNSAEAKSLNFRCLDANFGNSGGTGKPGTDSHELPAGPCAGGIRSQINFPTLVIFFSYTCSSSKCSNTIFRCWDGVNLDSPDHKVHLNSFMLLSETHSFHNLEPYRLSI